MPPTSRYQSSLKGILDFSPVSQLNDHQRTIGQHRFNQIWAHFDQLEQPTDRQYSRPQLLHHAYERARSGLSKDIFLRVFFKSLGIPLDRNDTLQYDELAQDVYGFADYLMDSFFIPMKASGGKTAQPTPRYNLAVQEQGSKHLTVGTPERLANLRGQCLVRDKHRCIVSRVFDGASARHMRTQRRPLVDDDGIPLAHDTKRPEDLVVAHILPHTLTQADSGDKAELNEAKKTALILLHMFDTELVHLIEGVDIDRPRNAITLTPHLHGMLGRFDLFFEPAPETRPEDHIYTISGFDPDLDPVYLPITRTLLSGDPSIDMPSSHLLALHCAIAHVLHLSGAGEYIDSLLRDMEKLGARSDGTTRLEEMVRLRLGGWWDGRVNG